MSNPFDQNPWHNQPTDGPRFGNAYESEPLDLPSGNAYEHAYGNAYSQPTTTQQPDFNNAWSHKESNKIECQNDAHMPIYSPSQQNLSPYDMNAFSPISAQKNAYQYSGTVYGNQHRPTGNAYSSVALVDPSPIKPVGPVPQSTTTVSAGPEPWNGEIYRKPSASHFWFRFAILLASIGHLGFAAGARPYSGEDIPFHTPAVFYYLLAIAALSIVYAAYHLLFYCYRRVFKRSKMNRPLIVAFDLIMAILWGIGVIIEVSKFHCTGGSKFCTFYNVSIFFGFLAFASYIVALFWDILGACRSRKRA